MRQRLAMLVTGPACKDLSKQYKMREKEGICTVELWMIFTPVHVALPFIRYMISNKAVGLRWIGSLLKV
jgi:hypothetical protein